MKPAAFNYHRPASLDEALALLTELAPDVKVLAGGQSLGPMLNMRLASTAHLLDINDLSEFSRIRLVDGEIEVGALARHHALANSELLRTHCPLLAQCAQTVGHYAIRQRGTLGGSLVNADPVAQLALAAVTLNARLTLVRQGARRDVLAGDFLRSAMTTAIEPQELLLAIRFPCIAQGEGSALQLFNRRHGDFAIVAVAATVRVQAGRLTRLALGVAGTSPVARRLDALAQTFEQAVPDAAWIAAVAAAAAGSVEPEDDRHISASYRRELTQTLVARALSKALERAAPTMHAGTP